MKKTLSTTILLFFTSFIFAQNFTFTNRFGGDSNELEGSDLLSYTGFNISDQAQLDYSGKYLEGRIRFDIFSPDEDGNLPNFRFRGYGKITPFSYLSLVAGNSFFSKFAIKGGELFALSGTPNYGKIIKNGIALYSEIPFDEKGKTKLKIGSAIESDSIFNTTTNDIILDFGFDFVKKGAFSIGASARNILAGEFIKCSLLGGINLGDFRINSGFIYNNTDTDLLPKKTRYSVSAGLEYKQKKLPFYAGFDFISGLNSEYLDNGDREVKSYSNGSAPFVMAGIFKYRITDAITAGFRTIYRDFWGTANNMNLEFYPNASWKFADELMEVSGGVRVNLTNTSGSLITNVSLPLMFTIKLEK